MDYILDYAYDRGEAEQIINSRWNDHYALAHFVVSPLQIGILYTMVFKKIR